jgi:hypothetical protein
VLSHTQAVSQALYITCCNLHTHTIHVAQCIRHVCKCSPMSVHLGFFC